MNYRLSPVILGLAALSMGGFASPSDSFWTSGPRSSSANRSGMGKARRRAEEANRKTTAKAVQRRANNERIALWKSGCCLMNRNWFLNKARRMGHATTGHTVWDAHCPEGTVEPNPVAAAVAAPPVKEFTHIDDWLDEHQPADEHERQVIEWLNHFRRPAIEKDRMWLAARRLTCTYQGRVCRCIGASRMGDVWLTKDLNRENGYDHRIDVTECSNWNVEILS